jgi:peptide deformylase
VARPELVRIEATDLEGDRFSIDADGWLARCVQHELDHLDGVLFVARVPMQSRLSIRERLQDLERAYGES